MTRHEQDGLRAQELTNMLTAGMAARLPPNCQLLVENLCPGALPALELTTTGAVPGANNVTRHIYPAEFRVVVKFNDELDWRAAVSPMMDALDQKMKVLIDSALRLRGDDKSYPLFVNILHRDLPILVKPMSGKQYAWVLLVAMSVAPAMPGLLRPALSRDFMSEYPGQPT